MDISLKYRSEHIDNIPLSVYKSAIQKYIRRSESTKALICANNLSLFFDHLHTKDGKRITTNIIHRIMIIFLEDVGIEGLKYWKQLDTLLLKNYKDKNSFINAVSILSSNTIPKSRIPSHLRAFFNNNNNNLYTYFPYKDIINEFFLSKNPFDLFITKFNYSEKDPLLLLSKKWYKELKNVKESFLTWTILLAKELFYPHTIIQDTFIYKNVTINTQHLSLDFFDEYVFDKHTKIKGLSDYSDEYFALVSSQVKPESKFVNKLLKTIYINQKVPSYHLEDGYGTFKFRCQLTTTSFKSDTYLIEKNDKLYVLKGPFNTPQILETYINYQKEKKEYNIPITNNRIVYLIPNRWNSVPLGIRNKLNNNIFYPFLVSKSIIQNIEEFKLKTHKSKLWPNTTIIDRKLTNLHLKDLKKDLSTPSLIITFLNILAFRCKYKLTDLALCNFMLYDNKLYSIDEESISSNFSLYNELKKTNYSIVKEFYIQYEKEINIELKPYLKQQINNN